MDASESPVLVDIDGAVATVRFNRPERMNTFVPELGARFLAVIESIGEGLTGGHFSLSFLGPVYSGITASQDVFVALVMISVVLSLWRRFVTKVKRLQGDRHEKLDAALILLAIFTIVSSLTLANATRIAMGGAYACVCPGAPVRAGVCVTGTGNDCTGDRSRFRGAIDRA